MSLQTLHLFGGTVTCQLPAQFNDISNVRSVPDTQEVFADHADNSVIFEILEMATEASTATDAAAFHFQSLQEDNGALEGAVDHGPVVLSPAEFPFGASQPGIQAAFVRGRQRIAKFNEGAAAANVIEIWLAVVRIPAVTTDVVITLNHTLTVSPQSTSATIATSPMPFQDTAAIVATILTTFQILDWSLFG